MLPVACTKDSVEETVVLPPESDKYTFIELIYDFNDKEELDFNLVAKDLEYNNPSSVEQVLRIGDNIAVKNFMFFESNDELVGSFFHDSINVQIPEYIDDKRIYLTKNKYLFSSNNINLPLGQNLSDSLIIEPNSRVKIKVKQVLKEYTIGFNLIYRDNISNQKRSIHGKWKCIKFVRLDYLYL